MKELAVEMKTIKSLSDKARQHINVNGSAVRKDSELIEALDSLHEALVTRTDMLLRAISELAAAVSALPRSGSQAHPITAELYPTGPEIKQAIYQELKREVRRVVDSVLSADAVVAVASKGDDELLDLGRKIARHFPQAEDGHYAGYYPSDSAEAIQQLESVRARGAQYLIFPSTAFWWFDYYAEFKQHLEKHYRLVPTRSDICLIYALDEAQSRPGLRRASFYGQISPHINYPGNEAYINRIKEVVSRVLSADAVVAVASKGDDELLALGGKTALHFPQAEDGRYAGYYPSDSAEAIRQLESVRARGAQYLILPSTVFWWFDYYAEFKQHLEKHYRLVHKQQHVCMIWDIGAKSTQRKQRRGTRKQ